MIIPETFASNVLPPQQVTVPCFPKRSSKNPRSDPDAYGVSPLSWDPVHLLRMELLSTSHTGPQHQMLWGLLLQMPNPQTWEPGLRLRTLPPVDIVTF